jgi:hypothetical protein
MLYHPRKASPLDSCLPTCYIDMNKEQAQERLDRANAWLACNTGLRGTPEYFSKASEQVFAMRRLVHFAIDTMDEEATLKEQQYCLSWFEHCSGQSSESTRQTMTLKLRHVQARLGAIRAHGV